MSRTILINRSSVINGKLSVPGDKSISHRLALLASVAEGRSVIEGFASSADCRSTLDCLHSLGIHIERRGEHLLIQGGGLRGYSPGAAAVELDAGNSGSTIRMICGLLAAHPFTSILDGDQSLRRRPMGRIIEPLRLMGCRIEAIEGDLPPLTVHGGPLKAIDYTSRIASAQVKTCVLLAGLSADGTTTFREPARSRDHTELMLPEFGARFRKTEDESGIVLSVEGGTRLNPVNYRIPGDLSSASFFIAAATLLPGSNLLLQGVNLNPTRAAFLGVLDSLGAKIIREGVETRQGELVGDLRVAGSALKTGRDGLRLSGAVIANLLDELPILGVVATQIEGRIEVRGAAELRVKESDRIRTVVDGIRALGGEIEEYEDGFAIEGPQRLTGGRVETAGDHRIAMAFSIAGLMADGVTAVSDADSISVSFPEFYDMLANVAPDISISYE